MKKNVFFVAAIFAALCLNSCDKNDPDNPIGWNGLYATH